MKNFLLVSFLILSGCTNGQNNNQKKENSAGETAYWGVDWASFLDISPQEVVKVFVDNDQNRYQITTKFGELEVPLEVSQYHARKAMEYLQNDLVTGVRVGLFIFDDGRTNEITFESKSGEYIMSADIMVSEDWQDVRLYDEEVDLECSGCGKYHLPMSYSDLTSSSVEKFDFERLVEYFKSPHQYDTITINGTKVDCFIRTNDPVVYLKEDDGGSSLKYNTKTKVWSLGAGWDDGDTLYHKGKRILLKYVDDDKEENGEIFLIGTNDDKNYSCKGYKEVWRD